MGWIVRLLGRPARDNALWLYVRCNHCGATVRVRVNLANDLSEEEDGTYILRKGIVDDRCFQPMHAELHFDPRRRVISRELTGGKFISEEEWAAGRG